MSVSPDRFLNTFETGAYSLAAGLSVALANGTARGNAAVAAVHADRAEAAALGDVARVARAVTADRLELRRLQAENAALKAELHAHRVRAAAVALRDGRRRVA
ncbi:hypothetical protein ACLBWX_18365 [Methylobacterium sp. M6A4_1b]